MFMCWSFVLSATSLGTGNTCAFFWDACVLHTGHLCFGGCACALGTCERGLGLSDLCICISHKLGGLLEHMGVANPDSLQELLILTSCTYKLTTKTFPLIIYNPSCKTFP